MWSKYRNTLNLQAIIQWQLFYIMHMRTSVCILNYNNQFFNSKLNSVKSGYPTNKNTDTLLKIFPSTNVPSNIFNTCILLSCYTRPQRHLFAYCNTWPINCHHGTCLQTLDYYLSGPFSAQCGCHGDSVMSNNAKMNS